jgi:hypothetical protein
VRNAGRSPGRRGNSSSADATSMCRCARKRAEELPRTSSGVAASKMVAQVAREVTLERGARCCSRESSGSSARFSWPRRKLVRARRPRSRPFAAAKPSRSVSRTQRRSKEASASSRCGANRRSRPSRVYSRGTSFSSGMTPRLVSSKRFSAWISTRPPVPLLSARGRFSNRGRRRTAGWSSESRMERSPSSDSTSLRRTWS